MEDISANALFYRHLEFSFHAAQADSHFQRCRTPGCNSGQQCFPEDTIMHCQACRHSTCIVCDIEMHHGVSCAEKAVERQASQLLRERASTKYLEKRAKKCPGCSAPTQKTGGCDHVTCKSTVSSLYNVNVLILVAGRICGHEYCWRCLADYGLINREGNEHHASHCPYHSDNL